MKKVIFVKYSNERSRRFSVRTDLMEDEQGKVVRKSAVYPEGKAHVQALLRWYQLLSKEFEAVGYDVNRCIENEQGVELEYLTGQTLEEVLDEKISFGEADEAKELLIHYLDDLAAVHSIGKFELTESFFHVFGKDSGIEKLMEKEGILCAEVTDLDLICANLYTGKKPVILDYEWTFDFPIPGNFVLYRVIHYYVDTHPMRRIWNTQELYRKYGITEEAVSVFVRMERAFQSYIEGECTPIRNLYDSISPGVRSWNLNQDGISQIFFETDGMITEENSICFPVRDGRVSFCVPIPPACTSLRIDPSDSPCIVEFLEFGFDGKKMPVTGVPLTTAKIIDNWGYFADVDPALEDIRIPEGACTFFLSLNIHKMEQEAVLKILSHMEQEASLRYKGKKLVQKLYGKIYGKLERK